MIGPKHLSLMQYVEIFFIVLLLLSLITHGLLVQVMLTLIFFTLFFFSFFFLFFFFQSELQLGKVIGRGSSSYVQHAVHTPTGTQVRAGLLLVAVVCH